MTRDGTGRPAEPSLQVLRVLWLSFLTATGVYIVVGMLIRSGGQDAAQLPALFPPVLGVAGLGPLALSFALKRPLARAASYTLYLIVRWALAELPAILGFVLLILGSSWAIPGILFRCLGARLLDAAPDGGDETGVR